MQTPSDPPSAASGTDLLTVDEVAAMLRTTPKTVRYWRHVGTGPRSARVGRRVLYRRVDVDAWVQARFDAEAAASA